MNRPSREPGPTALVATSVVGSLLVTASSYWAGATPLVYRTDPPAGVDILPAGAPVAVVVWYVGIVLAVLPWLWFGRRIWRGEPVEVRTLRVAGLASAFPLLFAVPLMSRDLWAYAAQARIAAAGLDPYTVTPFTFGDFSTLNVSARWVDTPSPYGPLWTAIGRGLAAVTGQHQLLGVLVLRLPAAVGFVLLVWAVPALARRVGASPVLATWLVVANPMVVLHGVGGGHNDTLMVGLVAVALLVTLSGGPRLLVLFAAGVLVGLGAAIKLPAVIVMPFLPLLWLRYRPGAPAWEVVPWREALRRRLPEIASGLAPALVGTVVTLAVCTVLGGHGLAWLSAANTGDHGGGPVGTVALLVVLVVFWVLATADRQWQFLAAALLAPALLSAFSLAWYWFWPLIPVAMVVRGRLAVFVMTSVAVCELIVVRPNGVSFALRPEFVEVVVVLVCWAVFDRAWRPFRGDRLPDADLRAVTTPAAR